MDGIQIDTIIIKTSSVPGGQIVELEGESTAERTPEFPLVKRLIGRQITLSDRPADIYELVTSQRSAISSGQILEQLLLIMSFGDIQWKITSFKYF